MQRERRFCQHGKLDEGNVAFVGVWGFTEKTGLSTGSGDGSQNGAGTANAGSSQGGTSSGLPQTGGTLQVRLLILRWPPPPCRCCPRFGCLDDRGRPA